jgi:hypothetical protein
MFSGFVKSSSSLQDVVFANVCLQMLVGIEFALLEL